MTTLPSLNRALRLVLWCGLVAGIMLMSLRVRQVDLWWQLPEGLSILDTHHLPTQPPAAFGLPANPYIDEYGLYEIGLGALYRLGGLAAIHVAFIATFLLIFLAPLTTARGVRRDIVSLALLGLAGIFMVNRYEQRPEIAGVLLFSLLLVLMRRSSGFGWRFLLRLGLLMTLWTNVHSSYLIGLLALFLWLVDRVFLCDPRLRWRATHAAITLAVVSACVLINPYGWHRIAFTFEQEHDMGSNLLSREMWPAWDQPPLVQALMVATAALLALAIVTRKRPPLWLVILAVVAFLLTLFNIRQMSFLAVTLLYLHAEWRHDDPSPRWQPARTLVLGAGCIAMLLFDAIALRSAVGNFVAGSAASQMTFAPRLVGEIPPGSFVLCHDAEGSYLSFAGRNLHPLIDSGQGRFDDDTKRFYFFAVEDPRGFNLALQRLPVDYVLVTAPAIAWGPAMIGRPGWILVDADDNGILFARLASAAFQAQPPIPRPSIARLVSLRDGAYRRHDPIFAFDLSVLIDGPISSLLQLDRSPVENWSEPFFRFVRDWIDRLPPGTMGTVWPFAGPRNDLLRELLPARVPSLPLPPAGPTDMDRLARVLSLVEHDDLPTAREVFATIPRPMVSPLYYESRDKLDSAAPSKSTAAERWQDWNDGGAELFDQVAPRLQHQLALLKNPGPGH